MSSKMMPMDELEGYKHQLMDKVVRLWRFKGLAIETVTGRLQSLHYNWLMPGSGLVATINSRDYYDIDLPGDIRRLEKQPISKLEEMSEIELRTTYCY